MFRYIYHAKVRDREFRQFFEAYEKWEALLRGKGYRPSQLFGPFTGTINAVMIMSDSDTIESFQKESDEFFADAEVMSAYREMGTHFDTGARDELWQTATQIA